VPCPPPQIYTCKTPSAKQKFSTTIDGNKFSNPTQTGIQHCRRLLRDLSAAGSGVFDLYGGSGTLTCAAILEGRDIIYVDIDPNMVALAKARIQDLIQKLKDLHAAYLVAPADGVVRPDYLTAEWDLFL
jgi:DNA modification methylase